MPMRKVTIVVIAAYIGLAASVSVARAGLFSATGTVIAIVAGELFVGEAVGHLGGVDVALAEFRHSRAARVVRRAKRIATAVGAAIDDDPHRLPKFPRFARCIQRSAAGVVTRDDNQVGARGDGHTHRSMQRDVG